MLTLGARRNLAIAAVVASSMTCLIAIARGQAGSSGTFNQGAATRSIATGRSATTESSLPVIEADDGRSGSAGSSGLSQSSSGGQSQQVSGERKASPNAGASGSSSQGSSGSGGATSGGTAMTQAEVQAQVGRALGIRTVQGGAQPLSPTTCSPAGGCVLVAPTPCGQNNVVAGSRVQDSGQASITCSGSSTNTCDVTLTLTDKNTTTGKIESQQLFQANAISCGGQANLNITTTINMVGAGDHLVTLRVTDDNNNSAVVAAASCTYTAK